MELDGRDDGMSTASTAEAVLPLASMAQQPYVTELLSFTLDRLHKEPELLRVDAERIRRQMQEVAVGNYRAFISAADALLTIRQEVSSIDQHLESLIDEIPKLTSGCTEFTESAEQILDKRKMNQILLANHSTLLDLLEIPQLMDTCVRNGNYDEALDLEAFVFKLSTMHPKLPVIKALAAEVRQTTQSLLSQLLQKLRSNIQLPECLRIIGYLRRIGVFNEYEMRLQFLRCREAWFTGNLDELDQKNPNEYLRKMVNFLRVSLFDVVNQYRAIFADDTSGNEENYDGGLLFSWAMHRITSLLKALMVTLPKITEGGSLSTVLENCMFCAMGLASVGLDFRGLLPTLFEEAVLNLLSKNMSAAVENFVGKAKDALRAEVESSAHMLVTGIEKISAKVSNFKNFTSGGLPRSQKYTTGLPAVSYGVIKRTNEIVEELLNQVDAASKSRNEAREQVEQRNYEIAIEVSQLEATISGLREEVEMKSKSLEEKDKKIAEVEKEIVELRELALESEDKFRNMESKIDVLRPLLLNQLNMVSKIHDRVHDIIKIVDDDKLSNSDMSESLFLPQETDENMCASLAGMDYIFELIGILGGKTKNVVEENDQKLQNLNETVNRLMKEKEDIGSLLRRALSKRTGSDTNQLFHVAENGLKKSGIDFHFSNVLRGGKHSGSLDKQRDMDTEEDEIFSLAGALENIVKASQLQIIELQYSVEELRAESKLLKEHVDIQAKDLNLRKKQIEELEEKERVANENVEGLMMDIAAAEEEITRWKEAAEQEAAAGKAIEQELLAQLSTIRQELEEAKESMLESEKKLKFKEETAVAAMAARDAAEKSLRLADSRSSRLRDKVEELMHQLEELDTRGDSRRSRNNDRYMCWPWEWLGLNYQGLRLTDTPIRTSNEMELSEPML